MRSFGFAMVLIGVAAFAWPAIRPGTQLIILTPFGEHAQIAGGIIGVVGLVVTLISFVRGGKKAEKK